MRRQLCNKFPVRKKKEEEKDEANDGSRNFERGGEFANNLFFFLKIYQYRKIKYQQLY